MVASLARWPTTVEESDMRINVRHKTSSPLERVNGMRIVELQNSMESTIQRVRELEA